MNAERPVLVIPCYNESKRLDFDELKKYSDQFTYFFVDDGSEDNTSDIIKENLGEGATIISLKHNRGKAEAVRTGMLRAIEQTDSPLIGFWDADLATPINEALRAMSYLGSSDKTLSVWCSRVVRLGADVKRSKRRHYLGRIFATFLGFFLNLHSYDSQCGAKLFRRGVIPVAFGEKFISNWVFDVEIAMRLGTKQIFEMPVLQWHHRKGSKIRLLTDSIKVFTDIILIRKHYGKLRS